MESGVVPGFFLIAVDRNKDETAWNKEKYCCIFVFSVVNT